MHKITKDLLNLAVERSHNPKRILDMGCGDGVIARALKEYFPTAEVWGTDSRNISVQDPAIRWVKSDLFNSSEFATFEFDLIVCTLPNMRSDECEGLSPEDRVKCDGGITGLECIQRFLKDMPTYLADNGTVIVSITPDQAKEFPTWEIHTDHGGDDRFSLFVNT